jgi:hypothetical protein
MTTTRLQEKDTDDLSPSHMDDLPPSHVVYLKDIFTDCETIDDIIYTLESLKFDFEKYKQDGYEVDYPLNTGFCHLARQTN